MNLDEFRVEALEILNDKGLTQFEIIGRLYTLADGIGEYDIFCEQCKINVALYCHPCADVVDPMVGGDVATI